jgi:hypothetical protein
MKFGCNTSHTNMKPTTSALFCIFAFTACVQATSPTPHVGSGVIVAQGTGGTTPTVPATPSVTCSVDADCEVSCERVDNCCPQLCSCSNVYHRTVLAGLREEHQRTCTGSGCPIAQCTEPTERTVAHCVSGRCEGQVVRIVSKGGSSF